MNQTSDAAGFSLRAGVVSAVQMDWRGANSVERINGEGTVEPGESDAEETRSPTLAETPLAHARSYRRSNTQLTLVLVLWGDDWRRAFVASAVNEGSRSLQAAVCFFVNPRGVAWRIQSSEPCSLPTGAFNPTAA